MKKYLIFIMGIVIGIVGTSYATYKLKAEQVSFDKTNTNLSSENVQDSIDEIALDLKNGKQLISAAITNKGIETKDTDSFATMADNIKKITSDAKVERKTVTKAWGTASGYYTHTVKATDIGLKYIFGVQSSAQTVGNAGSSGTNPNMHQDSLSISSDYTSFTATGWNSYYSATATQTYTCVGVK